jgi:hypothetical protein
MASQLYFIANPSTNDIKSLVENVYESKSYSLTKRNPYYGTNQKNEYAVVILQEDVAGLYYYFDGDEKFNKQVLKNLKKKKYTFTEINTKLKDSFDNIASEKVFGRKTEYVFSEEPTSEVQYENRRNFPVENKVENNISNTQTNVIKGYIGQLAAGTEIPAYLQNPLNTETVSKGDKIVMVLSKDLTYMGSVVAPQGSLIYGYVTKANAATYGRRNGQIQIDFNTLQIPDGRTYSISTELVDFKVEAKEGSAANVGGKIVAGAATTALITLLFASLGHSSNIGRSVAIGAGVGAATTAVAQGIQKGIDAEIPAYTEINLNLTKPLNFTTN